MGHKVYGSFQCQDGNIKTICLRCKFEIGMYIDTSYTKCIGWQGFYSWIYNIITESNMNLAGSSSGYTMASGNNMASWNQRATTSVVNKRNILIDFQCNRVQCKTKLTLRNQFEYRPAMEMNQNQHHRHPLYVAEQFALPMKCRNLEIKRFLHKFQYTILIRVSLKFYFIFYLIWFY